MVLEPQLSTYADDRTEGQNIKPEMAQNSALSLPPFCTGYLVDGVNLYNLGGR
jgi:hypothetical protein